jgi:hypothetical protein
MEAEMPVLITMRVKVHDFEGAKKAGCHRAKAYRSEKDPNDVLRLTPALAPQRSAGASVDWESHDAFNKSGEESGEEFNALVNPAGDRDDVVWHLSDAASVE